MGGAKERRSGMSDEVIYAPCTICGVVQDIKRLTTRTMICPDCVELGRAQAERTVARKKARDAFRDIIKQNRGERIDAPHISEMCATMIKELGGLGQFCADLVEDYMDARERSPGSATLLKFGTDIFRLVRDSSALRDTAPDAVNMTDDELAGEVLALLDRTAKKKRLEEAELGLLDVLLEDAHAQLNGRPPEGESCPPGLGGPAETTGGPEVLPTD